MTNWSRYEELSAKMDGRSPGTGDSETDRFHDAGTYANWATPDDASDEQWAEAFWSGWYENDS